MSSDMSCVLSSNLKISGVLVNTELSVPCKASIKGIDQHLHWRKGHLVRSSRHNKLKELETSHNRSLYESEQNIQRAHKLSEGSDFNDSTVDKERSFSSGLRTDCREYHCKKIGHDSKEASQSEWRDKNEHLNRYKNKLDRKILGTEYDRASILALAEEKQENGPLKEEMAKQVKCSSSFNAFKCLNIEQQQFWRFTQILPQLNGYMYSREVALSMVISGALFSIMQLINFRERSRKPSVRRRIVRSQWYGNVSSLPGEQKSFERRKPISPEHPRFVLDADKNKPQSPFADRSQISTQYINMAMNNELSKSQRASQKLIRQSLYGSDELPRRSSRVNKYNGFKSQTNMSRSKHTLAGASDNGNGALLTEKGFPVRTFPFGSNKGSSQMQDDSKEVKPFKMRVVNKEASQQKWGKEDELDLDARISQLYKTVQTVEQHRQAVMVALAEERRRSMLLEENIVMQKQAAAALAKEVQLLKESHNALLTSFRKKYSSAAAARAAADLVYQDFEGKAAIEKKRYNLSTRKQS